MELVQIEMHKLAQIWQNTHKMRPSANHESPTGRPDYLYLIPQSNNSCDYLTQVGGDQLDMAEEHCTKVHLYGVVLLT